MHSVGFHNIERKERIWSLGMDYNEWFSSNRRVSYAYRIMGSPGGKHWKSLQRNVWRGAVSPFKTSVFGQRMPHFAVILWEAEVTNVGALIVSFCGINAMKSIDKRSFLRKVDCEIYWMVSKYIVPNLPGINERGMWTHLLNLSSCKYMCWYLQRV